jgi:hypothetical protein
MLNPLKKASEKNKSFHMKKIYLFILAATFIFEGRAQEFAKQVTAAKTAYGSGKLEDTRFALQQMLQELDMITGKEILKLLPLKMLEQTSNAASDNVSGTSGFVGVLIHRDYGAELKKVDLEVISNSPMVASINSLLSLPFIGNSGDNKVIKINGYKALVQKSSGDNNKDEYQVQIPVNNSLITLKAPGYSQDDVIKMANTLPIAEIAKLSQ